MQQAFPHNDVFAAERGQEGNKRIMAISCSMTSRTSGERQAIEQAAQHSTSDISK